MDWLQQPMPPPQTLWYEEGSKFRAALGRVVEGVQFKVFKWSGGNSAGARHRAVRLFRTYLRRAFKDDPTACHLIIAHSHGGNIALEGSRSFPIAGIATLATPFLTVRPLRLTIAENWFLNGALWGLIQLPLLLALGGLYFYRMQLPIGIEPPDWLIALFFLLLLPLIFTLGVGDLIRALPPTPSHDDSEHSSLEATETPILVLRAHGDEAAWALGLARTGAEVSGFAWKVLRHILSVLSPVVERLLAWPIDVRGGVILLWYAVALYVLIIEGIMGRSPLATIFGILMCYPGAVLGLCTSLLILLAASLYSLAFGWDMLGLAFSADIGVDARPSGALHIQEVVLPLRKDAKWRGLRHSLYEFPSVVQSLAEWISECSATWLSSGWSQRKSPH